MDTKAAGIQYYREMQNIMPSESNVAGMMFKSARIGLAYIAEDYAA